MLLRFPFYIIYEKNNESLTANLLSTQMYDEERVTNSNNGLMQMFKVLDWMMYYILMIGSLVESSGI